MRLPVSASRQTRTLSKQSIARPPATEVIVGGRAEGQIDVSQLVIGAYQCPNICAARRFPGALIPGLVTELSLDGDGTELPQLLSGADIEASHIARRHLVCEGIIVNLRPHHDDIATDDGWRGDTVQTPVDCAAQPLRQVNASLLAEGGDGLARLGVQADQVPVPGAEQDALIVPARPVGNAAMHEPVVGRRSVLPRLRVVDPQGVAGGSVDGRNLGQ